MYRFYNRMRLRWNKLFRYQSICPPIPTVKAEDTDQEENKSYTEERSPLQDVVNSPIHYNQAGIECIDAIAAALGDGFEYYLQGNVMKYLWRYRYKNGIEDLKKAEWYQSKLIEMKERK